MTPHCTKFPLVKMCINHVSFLQLLVPNHLDTIDFKIKQTELSKFWRMESPESDWKCGQILVGLSS